MSNTQFIEAFSTDPFVRDIHRRALGYLNDPSLGRKERECCRRPKTEPLIEVVPIQN